MIESAQSPSNCQPGTALAFLFVYGTLLSGAQDHLGAIMRERLRRETTFIGRARVPGRLYNLGDYPGLAEVAPRERCTVRGEVCRLNDPSATLPWVDAYEDISTSDPSGGPYRRVPQLALLDDGNTLRCWAYVLNQVPGADRLIASGCWLSHVSQN